MDKESALCCGQPFGVIVMASVGGAFALAQLPTYQVGRTPTADEIHSIDTYVGPSGEGLPEGKGTVREGAKIFAEKCAICTRHHRRGGKVQEAEDGPAPPVFRLRSGA